MHAVRDSKQKMIQLKRHIIKWALGILPVLMTCANILAQDGSKAVPFFEVTQCDTLQLEVVDMPGDEYTWDIYGDSESNFATSQGDMESAVYFENGDYRDVSSVRVINLPVGEYFVKVTAWDEVQCTNNLMVFRMEVVEPPPPEVIGDSLCIGEVPLVKVIFSGTGPWDFEYAYSDGVNTVNLIGHAENPEVTVPITDLLPVGEHTFWIMEVVDGCGIAREFTEDERPGSGILIYPKPEKSKIYLKDD